MKYPFTGLYSFCNQLGNALAKNEALEPLKLSFYVPAAAKGFAGDEQQYYLQQSLHKVYNPANDTKAVWHGTYQSSNYFPKNNSQQKILTIHDLNFLYDERKSAEKKNKYLKQVQDKIKKATQLTVISEFTLRCVKDNLDTGNLPIEVIYNGCDVDLQKHAPVKPDFLEENEEYLFTVGTIAQKKNFHVLPCLLKNNKYKLVIAGINQDQAYFDKIISEAKKWKVEDRVILPGAVTEAEKFWLMKNAKAFLFPSLAEGFGLPVVEAMHFNSPIILSTCTSLPEIGADAAFYFNDFEPEHMQQVLETAISSFDHGNKQQAMQERAKFFSWENAASAYIKLYKKIAAA